MPSEMPQALLSLVRQSTQAQNSVMRCCTSTAAAAHTRFGVQFDFQWPCVLVVCHVAYPETENYAQLCVQNAFIEFEGLSAHRDSASKDLFTAGEENVPENSKSILVRPDG